MYKKLIYILLSGLICITSSCDDFLERHAIDQLDERNFYKNAQEIDKAVIACYSELQAGIKYEWYLTEIRSDNTRHNGQTSATTASNNIYELDRFVVATSNEYSDLYWKAVYHNIASCNAVLRNLDVVTDENLRKQYKSEALFIRAYHYFNLVRLYGPLFLVSENMMADDTYKMERSTVSDCYGRIIADLITASTDLPVSYPSSQIGRVDQWGAKALLAKVHMTLGQFDKAEPLLNGILTDSQCPYGLVTTSYSDIFSITNEMSNEIMFAIRFKSGGFKLGSPFGNYFAPQNSDNMILNGGGDGLNCPTEDLVAAYSSNDKRKNVTLAHTWNNATSIVYTSYVKKYLSPVSSRYDGESDWPVIRYADVVLMMGEVQNELNGVGAGLPYINQTRVRGGLTPLTAATVANQEAFRLEMEKERRLEFAIENHRFFDLLRTNRLISVMKEHYETETFRNITSGAVSLYYPGDKVSSVNNPVLKEWQLLLPIPYSVIAIAPNATQNPGY